MRKDMADVLREPGSRGGNGKRNRFDKKNMNFKRDEDAAPSKATSMGASRNFGYDRKRPHWSIKPVLRFIGQNVGRPWDFVWSEICDVLRSDTDSGLHIRETILRYIEREVVIDENGTPRNPDGRALSSWRWPNYYVHPETGLLCVAPKDKPRASARPPFAILDGALVFKKIDGVWYELVMKEWTDEERKTERARGFGAPLKWEKPFSSYLTEWESKYRYGSRNCRYASDKRQLNSREIRQLGLREKETQ